MIVGHKIGNIITGRERHVAFAINREGDNDAGLAGAIARGFWPELASTGPMRMGSILSKDTGKKVFHAMVVHSRIEGWEGAPDHIEACFNQLSVAPNELIASVAMGAGLVGRRTAADPEANLAAMERSNKRIVIYDLG